MSEIDRRLARIERKLDALLLESRIMSAELDQLEAQVKKNTDVEESAIVLITGLATQIAALKDDPVKLAKLSADLKAKADALAAAILANVPPAPNP